MSHAWICKNHIAFNSYRLYFRIFFVIVIVISTKERGECMIFITVCKAQLDATFLGYLTKRRLHELSPGNFLKTQSLL